MKKVLLSTIVLSSLVYANNSSISYEYGIKDYKNSMTKVDCSFKSLELSHKISNHYINLGFQGDNVDRKHSITNANLPSLDVEKYSAKYKYLFSKKTKLKASYIKIIDNLAPTDQGKVYGLGASYVIKKGLNTTFDFYKSDYKAFDVNQYDLSISKAFKFDEIKLKATAMAKKIDIDGEKYGSYTFVEKDYFVTGLKFGANYKGFVGGIGALFGERAFTVLNDGSRVQHHAMEQNKTYMLSLGKKFKNLDLIAKYSFQNGKELPENRDDVDTEVISLSLTYKF